MDEDSKEVGIHYIEASADNECDLFYGGKDYLKDWVQKAKKVKKVPIENSHFFTAIRLSHLRFTSS
jgi:hypothetical protein